MAGGIKKTAWLFLAVAAAATGYVTGLRQGQIATIAALQTEATGNLTQRLDVLSLIRIGDTAAGVLRLEEEVDHLTLSIAANRSADRRVLINAKAYRTAVPPPL